MIKNLMLTKNTDMLASRVKRFMRVVINVLIRFEICNIKVIFN